MTTTVPLVTVDSIEFRSPEELPSVRRALRAPIAIGRHGIRTKTMRGFEIDRLANTVADV